MTKYQIKKVCAEYVDILSRQGRSPARHNKASSREERLDHAMWMCGEIPSMFPDTVTGTEEFHSKKEKVMRWLGFVQGTLFAEGVRTIHEMRSDNRGEL
ncbi:MAG: hypothetical protein BWY99_02856 [Synergistetes bacterium ADurb.BinA166]|nr:MAG: hypothetical protein BWY99_02856 [Synergistetes bacterium ADurb.BinA166]